MFVLQFFNGFQITEFEFSHTQSASSATVTGIVVLEYGDKVFADDGLEVVAVAGCKVQLARSVPLFHFGFQLSPFGPFPECLRHTAVARLVDTQRVVHHLPSDRRWFTALTLTTTVARQTCDGICAGEHLVGCSFRLFCV